MELSNTGDLYLLMKKISDTYQYIPMPFGAFILKDVSSLENIISNHNKAIRKIAYNLLPCRGYKFLVFLSVDDAGVKIVDSSATSINSTAISVLNRHFQQDSSKFVLVADRVSRSSALLINRSCNNRYEIYFSTIPLIVSYGTVTSVDKSGCSGWNFVSADTSSRSDTCDTFYNFPAPDWEHGFKDSIYTFKSGSVNLQLKRVASGFVLERESVNGVSKYIYEVPSCISVNTENVRLFINPQLFREIDSLMQSISDAVKFLYSKRKILKLELVLPVMNRDDIDLLLELTAIFNDLELLVANGDDILINNTEGSIVPFNLSDGDASWIHMVDGKAHCSYAKRSPNQVGECSVDKTFRAVDHLGCYGLHRTYTGCVVWSSECNFDENTLKKISASTPLENSDAYVFLAVKSPEDLRILLTALYGSASDLDLVDVFLYLYGFNENRAEYEKALYFLSTFFNRSINFNNLLNFEDYLNSEADLIYKEINIVAEGRGSIAWNSNDGDSILKLDNTDAHTDIDVEIEGDRKSRIAFTQNTPVHPRENADIGKHRGEKNGNILSSNNQKIENIEKKNSRDDALKAGKGSVDDNLTQGNDNISEMWSYSDEAVSRISKSVNTDTIPKPKDIDTSSPQGDDVDLQNTSYIKRRSIINNINNLAIKINDLKIDDENIENFIDSIDQDNQPYKLSKNSDRKIVETTSRHRRRELNKQVKNIAYEDADDDSDDTDGELDYTREFNLNVEKTNKDTEEEVDICTNFEDFLDNSQKLRGKKKEAESQEVKIEVKPTKVDEEPLKHSVIGDVPNLLENTGKVFEKHLKYGDSSRADDIPREVKEHGKEAAIKAIKNLIKTNNHCTRADKNRLLKFLGSEKYRHHLEAITEMFSKYPTLSKMKDNKRGQEILANLSIIYGYVNGDFREVFNRVFNLNSDDSTQKELIASAVKCTENSLKFLSVYSGISIHSIPFDITVWNYYRNINTLYEINNIVANGYIKNKTIVYLIYSHCSHRVNLLVHNKQANNITIFHASTYFEIIYKKFDQYKDSAIIGLVDTKSINLKKINRNEVIKHMIQIYNMAQQQNFLFDISNLPTNYPIGMNR